MKRLSIRLKITLWFSLALLCITALTILVILTISNSVIQKGIQDNLTGMVEDNVDEVEFYRADDTFEIDKYDLYLNYPSGYLEIDDDFLSSVNGIVTTLYDSDGTALYGKPAADSQLAELPFSDGALRTVRLQGTSYYVYDRALKGDGLDGLWLRGTVSRDQGITQIHGIAQLAFWLMPLLVVAAAAGGYAIAGFFLRPIQQIRAAADNIRAGNDLTKRIALGPGDDELHQLADTFDSMFDRLETSFQAQQQFTSDVSHELRTPTAVILAQCEFTLEEPREASEYIEALQRIQRQGGKMSETINALLEFTRLEQSAGSLIMERTDLSALVTATAKDMALIQDKNITLHCTVQPDLEVSGNASLLSRLLNNLISNAYRYGKDSGQIHVILERQEMETLLSISDDGIGIAPEKLARIFDRLYQADPSRSGKGLGLGLAMAKEIATLHGGYLTVNSFPDEGSTFTLHLPNK